MIHCKFLDDCTFQHSKHFGMKAVSLHYATLCNEGGRSSTRPAVMLEKMFSTRCFKTGQAKQRDVHVMSLLARHNKQMQKTIAEMIFEENFSKIDSKHSWFSLKNLQVDHRKFRSGKKYASRPSFCLFLARSKPRNVSISFFTFYQLVEIREHVLKCNRKYFVTFTITNRCKFGEMLESQNMNLDKSSP